MNDRKWIKKITEDMEKQKHLFGHISPNEVKSKWEMPFGFHLNALKKNLKDETKISPFMDKDNSFLKFYPSTLLPFKKKRKPPLKRKGFEEEIKKSSLKPFLKPDALIKNGILYANPDSSASVGFCPLWAIGQNSSVYPFIEQRLSKKNGTFFSHLASALPAVGWVLNVNSSHKAGEVFHIHYDFDEKACARGDNEESRPLWNLRNFLFLKTKGKFCLLETLSVRGAHFINYSTDIHVSAYAECNWLRVEEGDRERSFLLEHSDVKVDKKGRLNRMCLQDGFLKSNESITCSLLGEGAGNELSHLSLLARKQMAQQSFEVKHKERAGFSRQYSRSVIKDEAKMSFQGNVNISRKSPKSDCVQSARAFLLDKKARALLRPELEIHNHDVKAQHGATTHKISDEELFYLESRGLGPAQSREILISAIYSGDMGEMSYSGFEGTMGKIFLEK